MNRHRKTHGMSGIVTVDRDDLAHVVYVAVDAVVCRDLTDDDRVSLLRLARTVDRDGHPDATLDWVGPTEWYVRRRLTPCRSDRLLRTAAGS